MIVARALAVEVWVPSTTEWMSTAEAAKALGVTPRTLYRFIDHGDLVAYRFGRVIRIKAVDIDVFVEANRVQPGELKHLYPDTAVEADSESE